MLLNSQHWDMYFILNPVSSDFVGVKPFDKDIEHYRRFIVDCDPLTSSPPDFTWNGPSPRIYVSTGNGVQLHYDLKDWKDYTVAEIRGRVSAYLHQLKAQQYVEGYKVDTSTSDASRMVRMPQTINWKTGRRGTSTILNTYSHSVPVDSLPTSAPIVNHEPFNGDLTNLSKLAPRLTHTAATFLLSGVDTKVGERHKSAFAAAANLRRLGVSFEHATEWVLYGASICTPPLAPNEAMHCVRTAYKNVS